MYNIASRAPQQASGRTYCTIKYLEMTRISEQFECHGWFVGIIIIVTRGNNLFGGHSRGEYLVLMNRIDTAGASIH